jgi:hypothetical protein
VNQEDKKGLKMVVQAEFGTSSFEPDFCTRLEKENS